MSHAPFGVTDAEKQGGKAYRRYTAQRLRRWTAVTDCRSDDMIETTLQGPVSTCNVFVGLQPVLAEFILGAVLVFGKQEIKMG